MYVRSFNQKKAENKARKGLHGLPTSSMSCNGIITWKMQILENELMKNHSKISCHQFHTVIYWFWYLICAITTKLLHIFWARWDETMICLAHHLQLLIWKIIYNCPRTIFGLKKSQKSLMHISSSISLWLSIEYLLRTWQEQFQKIRLHSIVWRIR